jgi:hypothetical protein
MLFNNYDNIILTNDSIIITRSLFDFEKLFLPNIEMTGIVAVSERAYHYPDFMRRYNKTGLRKIMSIFQKYLYKFEELFPLIITCEVNSMCEYTTITTNVLYDFSKYQELIHYDNNIIKETLSSNYPILKVKKIGLSTEYISKNFPIDFNPKEYKSLNSDLKLDSDIQLTEHFRKDGMKEGRLYKKNQKIIFCEALEKFIKSKDDLQWIMKYTTGN